MELTARVPLPPLVQLARIRKNVGVTQAELGARVKLSGQFISMLEGGLRPSSLWQITALAEALGVSPEVLSAERIHIDCSSTSGVTTVATSAAPARR